jgi:flavin-dependent dehydrogenase
MRQFDVAILGSGPVGLIAGLRFALSGRRVVIASNRLPAPGNARRVDAVPASFLALLVELGINPIDVGADRLHHTRASSWASAKPLVSEGSSAAHVERPALDIALLDVARRAGSAIRLRFRFDGRGVGDRDWTARCFIDATGRAASTATLRIRPPKPWIARTFWAPASTYNRGFAIAQLPQGYAYRLGAASTLTFGVVGRREVVAGNIFDICQHLRAHAPWFLDGMPPFNELRAGGSCSASVQWSEGRGLRIGDAALARDALSSQGIATGASEAMLACAIASQDDSALVLARQREQRQAHLRSLLGVLQTGRFSKAPAWDDYIRFVLRRLQPETFGLTAASRKGRVESASLANLF